MVKNDENQKMASNFKPEQTCSYFMSSKQLHRICWGELT